MSPASIVAAGGPPVVDTCLIRVNLQCHGFRGGSADGSGDAGQESSSLAGIVHQAGGGDE